MLKISKAGTLDKTLHEALLMLLSLNTPHSQRLEQLINAAGSCESE